MAQAKRALARFESDLSARENVVGLGIVPADETGSSSAEMAVAVYVKKKLPLSKLRAAEVVPKELLVESRTGKLSVPTRVIDAGGEIRPESVEKL
ncbi:MAG: hypothetical protein M3032_03700 [Verrucomicrobiota bacterium]|nr:hypothetical protein [Verrucomicrobiota bacterium]